ncbi:hypothetical protein SAMN05216378_0797 [Paenibacillus catalpae]|uniref:Uncharacterized protein n=1 Tax=Paenibacillus catalpae TaxID=1045775 RepID=A0A1I1U0B2_9BACL|nr:hypothetical protein [Paenibacillus catalpae]SFD64252.1 hypothetical protein SAMN05216378_0797 [Paenibacillus catalpae]
MTAKRAWCMAKVCSLHSETNEQRTRQDETGDARRKNDALQESGVAVINGNKFFIIED